MVNIRALCKAKGNDAACSVERSADESDWMLIDPFINFEATRLSNSASLARED